MGLLFSGTCEAFVSPQNQAKEENDNAGAREELCQGFGSKKQRNTFRAKESGYMTMRLTI